MGGNHLSIEVEFRSVFPEIEHFLQRKLNDFSLRIENDASGFEKGVVNTPQIVVEDFVLVLEDVELLAVLFLFLHRNEPTVTKFSHLLKSRGVVHLFTYSFRYICPAMFFRISTL